MLNINCYTATDYFVTVSRLLVVDVAMASSNAGLACTQWSGTHECRNCGNTIQAFFIITTNNSSGPADVTSTITCNACNTTSPVDDTNPVFPSWKDPAGGVTGTADDVSRQPVEDSDDLPEFPSRETFRRNTCATETRSSSRHNLSVGVRVPPRASTQACDRASSTDLQTGFAKAKSSFFSRACSCGRRDRFDFLYVSDNEDGEILMRECKTCGEIIGLDDTAYDELLSWIEGSKNVRVSICECGNGNPDTFVVELIGEDIALRCGQCRNTIPVRQKYGTKEECLVSKQCESRVPCSDGHPIELGDPGNVNPAEQELSIKQGLFDFAMTRVGPEIGDIIGPAVEKIAIAAIPNGMLGLIVGKTLRMLIRESMRILARRHKARLNVTKDCG